MIQILKPLWADYVRPMLRRPERLQFAALCFQGDGADRRVLLITSRGTGRWVIPKGWPIKGLDSAGSAMREAWEEAGVVKGDAARIPVGNYVYAKGLPGGWSIPVRTLVFPVRVTEMTDDFPEAHQRTREWVSPAEAAQRVDEPALKAILSSF